MTGPNQHPMRMSVKYSVPRGRVKGELSVEMLQIAPPKEKKESLVEVVKDLGAWVVGRVASLVHRGPDARHPAPVLPQRALGIDDEV